LVLTLLSGGVGPGFADLCPTVVEELGGSLILSTTSGRGLWLSEGERLVELSDSPGCGVDVWVHDGSVFFKECPRRGPQRIVRAGPDGDAQPILSRDVLSGPFAGTNGPVACVEGAVLLLDPRGAVGRRVEVDGLPGTACELEGRVFWIDGSGRLCVEETGSGSRWLETGQEPLAAVRPVLEEGLLLLERRGGGCALLDPDGGVHAVLEDAGFPAVNGGRLAYVMQEARGSAPVGGQVVVYDVGAGAETRLKAEGPPAKAFPLSSGEVVYTDLQRGVVVGREAMRVPAMAPEVDGLTREGEIDVPYMHQLFDTPDWFDGGWSCGPTSCMMASQYYDRLTPDSIWCSWPSPGHYSEWGEYVPEIYTFLGHTYDVWGISPGNVWVQGAHGFICREAGGAYWDYMVLWMEQHGLYSAWAGTSWSTYTEEIDNGWPMVASTSSIYTPGHILLFEGYYDDHSVLVNDPYGDQNQSGWGGSYNGEDVVYDWYPYNNGHVQVHVAQVFYARSDVPTPRDTLVDNVSLGFRKLGPCQYWHETHTGFGGAAWWTYSTSAPPDTCLALWKPGLPWAGEYEVLVYVPLEKAEAMGVYSIATSSGPEEVALDQSLYSGQWASLGSFQLDLDAYVRLGDYTGEHWEYLAFDAIRFSPVGTGVPARREPVVESSFRLAPNPCTEATMVRFAPGLRGGRVTVYDRSGRVVGSQSWPGSCDRMQLSTSDLPSGAYLVRLEAGGSCSCRKLVVLGP
jgi:hypothetical protein